MPTLWDLFNSGDISGAGTEFNNVIGQNRNSLVGLGLGLASGGVGGGLQGYQAGANTDVSDRYRQAQIKQHQDELALRKQQFGFQQQQAGVTEAQKAMRDVLGPDASPQAKADFMKSYYAPKTEGDWSIQDVGVDQWNRPIKRWVNKRTREEREVGLGGGTAAAAAAPDAFTTGTPPVYGAGGVSSYAAPPAMPPPAAAPAATGGGAGTQPYVMGPNGVPIAVPPGVDLKTFQQHMGTGLADIAMGKLTEPQANAQIFANRMENAEPVIQTTMKHAQGLEGLSGKLADYLPVGSDIFNTPGYQRYSRAKLDWITAQLRKESGAAINADEYKKSDRTFFPQPNDSEKTIADKAEARRIETESMKRAAGPGYKGLQGLPPAPAAAGAAGGGGGAPAAPVGGRTGGAAIPAPIKWGRDENGNPVPLR